MKGINADYERSWLLGQCKRQPKSRKVAERRLSPASRNLSTKICINQTANKSGQTNRFYMHPSLAQSGFTAIIINSWRPGNNSIIPQTPVRSITRRGRHSPLQSKHARGENSSLSTKGENASHSHAVWLHSSFDPNQRQTTADIFQLMS